jgi:tetratricopeptide (TPR) repeat protein
MTRPGRHDDWIFGAGMLVLGACAASPAPTPGSSGPPTQTPSAASPQPPAKAASGLERAEHAFAESRYADAEALFRQLLEGAQPLPDGAKPEAARRGLARVLMITGRHAEAQSVLNAGLVSPAPAELELRTLLAESLWQSGQGAAAISLLESLQAQPEARRARLLLGEVLIAHGRRRDAEPVLMTLIEDYNQDRIAADDGPGLALVGRAAHLLRSPHDANDAFNAAERASPGDTQTLLWRAELFLEKHDPGHAEEVISELLARAPHQPEALVWMAHVKLEQALDFDAARALVTQALAIDSTLPHAYFVLAGLALRDLDFKTALEMVDRGLRQNPEHLDLLSMRAAVGFLSEDTAGFENARQKVFAQNPSYSRFYSIVGEFAEWEHRYDRIVSMMREAVAIDDEDAEAHAALGLNLIRAGQEVPGVQSLRRASEKDPFNVRVFNTLNLYEQTIPESYVTRQAGRFSIRYPKGEAELLERYVPALLNRAWAKFSAAYGFTPSEPIGIELYEFREHFAVRTSGLPQTAIQGVCFGKTLASLTPRHESFNLGMTLWHELAHVFHIQMSESHVPRWLTEGLAEYETLVERREWRRHHDPELFAAWRERRLPPVDGMNRAFSHAADMQDMATAYYASSQIAGMLVERFGRDAVNQVLRLHARGMNTNDALSTGLGADAAAVDGQFSQYLTQTLSRYAKQFVPLTVRGELPELIGLAKAAPTQVSPQLQVVLGALRDKQLDLAKASWAKAAKLDAKAPDVIFLGARLAAAEGQEARALSQLAGLVQAGHDGYAVQMAMAELGSAKTQPKALGAALRKAHEFDPDQSEPLQALWQLAKQAGDELEEIRVLKELAPLEEHEAPIYRRLLSLLVARKEYAEALPVGEAAVYVDIEGIETHSLYAQALAGEGRFDEASFEFESALLSPSRPSELAAAHVAYANFLQSRGELERARVQLEKAREVDPGNPLSKTSGAP